MGKPGAAKLVLIFLLYRLWICHLSCKKYSFWWLQHKSEILVGFCTVLMLHCQTSASTGHDDSYLFEEMKLLLLNDTFDGENDTSDIYHSDFKVLFQHILHWTKIWTQTFIVAYENPIYNSVKLNSCCQKLVCSDAVKVAQTWKKAASNQSIRMQYFWSECINFQSELV